MLRCPLLLHRRADYKHSDHCQDKYLSHVSLLAECLRSGDAVKRRLEPFVHKLFHVHFQGSELECEHECYTQLEYIDV